MLTIILLVIAVILITIGLVWLVDKFIPAKLKPVLIILLWVVIGILGYQTFMSVYEPIKFNKVKKKRYAEVIEKSTLQKLSRSCGMRQFSALKD